MSITYEDRLRDGGHYEITPEQEREIEAREECERLGVDPDEVCADGGVLAWMIVDQRFPWPAWRSDYPEFGPANTSPPAKTASGGVEMTDNEMIDAAEANIRADYRAGTISKEQFQKELLIVARARQQAPPPAVREE